MKFLNTLRTLLACVLLMSMSLTAFGQSDTIIKPVKRYVQDGDTFTVFRIQHERELAYKIVRGEELAGQVIALEAVMYSAYEERILCDSSLKRATRLMNEYGLQVADLKALVQNCEQRAGYWEDEAKKYRRQRNWAGVGLGVALLLLIII